MTRADPCRARGPSDGRLGAVTPTPRRDSPCSPSVMQPDRQRSPRPRGRRHRPRRRPPLRRGRHRRRRAARRLGRHRRRPPDRRHGPVGLRQVDAHAHPRRPRPAHRRARSPSPAIDITRPRRQRADEAAPRPHRLHLPVLQPAPDAHGGREHRAAAQARRRQARPGVARRARSTRSASATASSHRPSELSGGQQQRVAVARALVSRPSVMFADEPTGNLDSTTSGEILALLRDSVDTLGQTTVMVTHDAHAAAIADRVLFLADGDIVRDLGPLQRPRDPRDARGGERAMIGRRPQGPRGPQGPRAAHRARRRHRRLDGQRHLHPHRHDAEVLRRPLHRVLRPRPTPSSAARRSSRTPPAAAASRSPRRCSTRSGRCPRSTPAAGEVSPQEANVADIIGTRRQDGRQGERRRQLRRRQRALQPAQAQDRQVAARARRGRDRRRHRQEEALRGRRHGRRLDARQEAHLPHQRHASRSATSTRSASRSIAAWDVKTAQTLLNREGRYDAISVAAKDGTSPAQLVQRDQAARRRRPARSRTAPSRPRTTPTNINDGMTIDPHTSCSASAASRCSSARS